MGLGDEKRLSSIKIKQQQTALDLTKSNKHEGRSSYYRLYCIHFEVVHSLTLKLAPYISSYQLHVPLYPQPNREKQKTPRTCSVGQNGSLICGKFNLVELNGDTVHVNLVFTIVFRLHTLCFTQYFMHFYKNHQMMTLRP